MTTVEIQRLGYSSGAREARALESLARAAAELLGGRTIWSVDPPRPEGPASAERIGEEQLLAGGRLSGDDLVLLHDPLDASMVAAIRDHGAHALWLGRGADRVVRQGDEEASGLSEGDAPAIDAYVVSWREPGGAAAVAAYVPSAELLAARRIALGAEPFRRAHLAWSSLLADVVGTDRRDCVGGTLHARPSVAAR